MYAAMVALSCPAEDSEPTVLSALFWQNFKRHAVGQKRIEKFSASAPPDRI
jgi:hypothetical protein